MIDNRQLYRSLEGYEKMMAHYERQLSNDPAPYDTYLVPTRFGTTHILAGGPKDAPPILLFHGWNGNAAGTGSEFSFLFSNYRVYVPDIIGHAGKSAPQRLSTDTPDYAHWACDVLDALDIERAYVIGISGGGWMTLKFCAYYSHRIKKAVALSSDGLTSVNLPGIIFCMLPAVLFPSKFTMRRFVSFMTSSKGMKDSDINGFVEFLRLLKDFKTQNNPGLLSNQELGQISAPLLLLMGEDERLFPPKQAISKATRFIPSLIAGEIVPQAGHLMTIDQPFFLATRIKNFLDT